MRPNETDRDHRSWPAIAAALGALGLLLAGCPTGAPIPAEPCGDFCINEYMAANHTGYRDTDVDYPDWIELYNPGEYDLHIGGYTITDDLDFKTKYTLPEDTWTDGVCNEDGVRVPPGAWALLLADTDMDDDLHEFHVWHLPFKLSREGGAIGLYDAEGEPVEVIEYGEQQADVSMSRAGDGGETWHRDGESTPGDANNLHEPEEESEE